MPGTVTHEKLIKNQRTKGQRIMRGHTDNSKVKVEGDEMALLICLNGYNLRHSAWS